MILRNALIKALGKENFQLLRNKPQMNLLRVTRGALKLQTNFLLSVNTKILSEVIDTCPKRVIRKLLSNDQSVCVLGTHDMMQSDQTVIFCAMLTKTTWIPLHSTATLRALGRTLYNIPDKSNYQ